MPSCSNRDAQSPVSEYPCGEGSDGSHPRLEKNNFDLLRLLFAVVVCLVHAYSLSGYSDLVVLAAFLSSDIAIEAFFVVSGFLIFMSYEKSSSIKAYAIKRARRIYPAYFVIVLVCAVGLMFASSYPAREYFSSSWLEYVWANLIFANFMQPTLPGVFEENRYTAVNGALWTLKIEVIFYLSVPLFVFLFKRFGRLPVISVFYVLSVMYAFGFSVMAERTGHEVYAQLERQFPGQISYFMAGGFLFYYLKMFERNIGWFVSFAVIALLANSVYPLPLLEPLGLAIIVVFFGLFWFRGNFGMYGDFSYGVYIVHFPIIQILLHLGWFAQYPWLFLLSVLFCTGVCAFLMWHLVEKRFLRRSSHYIRALR